MTLNFSKILSVIALLLFVITASDCSIEEKAEDIGDNTDTKIRGSENNMDTGAESRESEDEPDTGRDGEVDNYEADPNCHYDCIGEFPPLCIDGAITTAYYGPIPCEIPFYSDCYYHGTRHECSSETCGEIACFDDEQYILGLTGEDTFQGNGNSRQDEDDRLISVNLGDTLIVEVEDQGNLVPGEPLEGTTFLQKEYFTEATVHIRLTDQIMTVSEYQTTFIWFTSWAHNTSSLVSEIGAFETTLEDKKFILTWFLGTIRYEFIEL